MIMWILLLGTLFNNRVALLSGLLLLAIPAFIDLGFLFSPHSFALVLACAGFFFLRSRPIISGICGILIFLSQGTVGIFYLLVIFLWALFDKTQRTGVLICTGITLGGSLPYFFYFFTTVPSFTPVLGNQGLAYLFLKLTYGISALAFLGMRKEWFALSLGIAGLSLSLLQPTNFVYLAFPVALFSAFFIEDFLFHHRWHILIFIILFWILLLPSQEYTSKLQPAADEYESYTWLMDNAIEKSVIACGWYQAPMMASVSGMTPLLGFGFPDDQRVADVEAIYGGDSRLLQHYDVGYVYHGMHEAIDYAYPQTMDRVYSGKGDFFKREPSPIYILFTVDTEPDLPPILSTYEGMEEGIPFLSDLFSTYEVHGTFFVLGETAVDYPQLITHLAQDHEIGCHGMHHISLKDLSPQEKELQVEEATEILQNLAGTITSFRSPGHSCDTSLVHILQRQGYTIEASACKEHSYPYNPSLQDWLQEGTCNLLRVPVSHTPAYFYAPLIFPRSWIECYEDALEIQSDRRVKIVVIGLHPWECIPLKAPGYELYTQACGEYTRIQLADLLEFLSHRRISYLTMNQLYDLWEVI
jgi:peptidoglycan/xylan/chitin deacetylase (PgdA/CDA1 family)